MQCPACAAEAPEGDLFCENCGQRLDAASTPAAGSATACACGAPPGEVDGDGFCERCGRRVVRPATDHIENNVSPAFAAVGDRGIRHDRNEDRFAVLQVGEAYVMVVCDGVSATRKSEIASSAVSEAVMESLAATLRAGQIAGQAADSEAALRAAIAAGIARLAAEAPAGDRGNSPSTTVVAALVAGGVATVAWMGDSRAYWIGADGAQQLTRDHSWLNEAITAGIPAEQVANSPKAHAITRWIGADAGEDAVPDVVRHAIREPGILLLCSDGLWNYAPAPEAIAALFHSANGTAASGDSMGTSGDDALAICRRLVQFANDCGGQDNVTVAILKLGLEPEVAKESAGGKE